MKSQNVLWLLMYGSSFWRYGSFCLKKKKRLPQICFVHFDEVDFGHFSDLKGQTNFDAGKKWGWEWRWKNEWSKGFVWSCLAGQRDVTIRGRPHTNLSALLQTQQNAVTAFNERMLRVLVGMILKERVRMIEKYEKVKIVGAWRLGGVND